MNTNKKEYFMNNFKKIGLTALAGSLVAVSAHAGVNLVFQVVLTSL